MSEALYFTEIYKNFASSSRLCKPAKILRRFILEVGNLRQDLFTVLLFRILKFATEIYQDIIYMLAGCKK